MPKQGTRAEVNTFVKGLITEASPLNFPANASLDEINFELNRDGTRDRRLGLDLESNFSVFPTTITTPEFLEVQPTTYKWFSVAGDASREFLVVRLRNILYFYNYASADLSRDGFVGSVVLSYNPASEYSFASVDGRLVIAGGAETISVVTYDPSGAPVFAVENVSLRVRDLWGVEELDSRYEDDVTFRGGLDARHLYNLQNQSWGIPRKDKDGNLVDPLTPYLTIDGRYPSNSEVVWTGLQYQPVVTTGDDVSDPYERVFPNLYQDRFGADIKSAKGYFIIDFLRRGQSRAEAYSANYLKYPQLTNIVSSVPSDTTPDGATVATEFAGRVFFAGFNGVVIDGDARSPNLANYVLFSQLVKSTKDVSKCYQEGDPTSRDSNDIVDTDGGFFRVAGAKRIIAMRNLGANLIIMADNGVWSVTGGNNYGFSATNYKVDKISNYGCISASSVVIEGSRLIFWAEDGIYIVGKDQYGDYQVNSATADTIQTLYENIPNTSKENASGVYDLANRKVKWIYKVGDGFTSSSDTYELVLDTVIGCFYRNRIAKSPEFAYEVYSPFPATAFKRGLEFSPVLVGADPVYVDADPVGQTQVIRFSGFQASAYLIVKREPGNTVSFTFGNYRDVEFRDWKSVDNVGTDAEAYLLTGAITAGDSAIPKQTPYVTVHFRRTESGVDADLIPLNQSSCIMRSQWDWANSVVSNKWGREFQAYKYRLAMFSEGLSDDYDNGFETIVSKNKLRGRGKALSLHFRTEPYKDCRILGWSLTINGNSIT